MKIFRVKYETTNGFIQFDAVRSKNLQGAIRKLYQTYDVERIISFFY